MAQRARGASCHGARKRLVVARRARPMNPSINHQEQEALVVTCGHDGYLPLKGRNTHQRKWHFSKNKIVIQDVVDGDYSQAEAILYFHPEVAVSALNKEADTDLVVCHLPGGKRVMVEISNANTVFLKPSAWYPFFGEELSNHCLVAEFSGKSLLTTITW